MVSYNRIVKIRRHPWRWSNPTPQLRAGSARGGCSGHCWVGFWVSAKVETATTMGSLFQCFDCSHHKRSFSYIEIRFLVFVTIIVCLFTRYPWEESDSIFSTPFHQKFPLTVVHLCLLYWVAQNWTQYPKYLSPVLHKRQ